MFVLPKPDPRVLDMEIIFFFGNVLKSGIRYLYCYGNFEISRNI
jgi:hypothetical protein